MRGWVLAVTGFVTALSDGANAQIVTLEDALKTAYRKNDTLAIDRLGLEALEQEIGIARTGYRPTLLVEGTVQRTELDIENTGYTGGLRLQQPLFRGGQTRAAVRAAKANVSAGRSALAATENDIMLAVTTVYADVLLAREVLQISRDLKKSLSSRLSTEQRRLQAGDGTRTAVAQSEARLAQADASLARAQANLEIAEQDFLRLVGSEPGAEMSPINSPVPAPARLDKALQLMRKKNPFVNQLRHSAAAAEAQVAQRRGAMLPTLSLEARLQYRDQVFEFTGVEVEQTLGTVGATLQVPIYQAGGARAQLRRAKAVRSLRRSEVTEALRESEAAVVAAWETYRANAFAVKAEAGSVDAYRVALEGVVAEARLGTSSTTDVLDAEERLNQAEIQYATSQRDFQISEIELLAAIGLYGAEDLGLSEGTKLPKNFIESH